MITVLNRSYPTARKEHRCMYCGGTIKVGEKYDPETKGYGIVKIFTNSKAAEDEKQSLETYEKIL